MDCVAVVRQMVMRMRFWLSPISLIFRRLPLFANIGHGVWRFFQARYSVGVVGVIFDRQGKVLLAKHAFHSKHMWGLPGGWVGGTEDPAAAVKREIKEELSMDIEVGAILLAEKPYKNHLDLAYLCSAESDQVGNLSFELLEYGWFDVSEMPKILCVHHRAIQRAVEITRTAGGVTA